MYIPSENMVEASINGAIIHHFILGKVSKISSTSF